MKKWENIPLAMRNLNQWCLSVGSDDDKAPLSVKPSGALYKASSANPLDWLSFEKAVHEAATRNLHIGFMLSDSDNFCCIDLDVKDATTHPDEPQLWTTQGDYDRYWRIVKAFNSFTEVSRSGKGLHIWTIGTTAQGKRRNGVEIYSNQRFIITTGNPINNVPIVENQELLNILYAEIEAGQKDSKNVDLVEIEEEFSDTTVFQMASEAANGDKFQDLCEGHWQKYNYPSQSEADLSLMSMLCFYSKSNEQCRRIFRMTKLGTRDKAVKNNRYLDYTLSIIRSRQADEMSTQANGEEIARALIEEMRAKRPEMVEQQLHVLGPGPSVEISPPKSVSVALAAPIPAAIVTASQFGLPWPPGLAGRIANFIYQSSPRPVKEVAIISALGLLAGICGKSHHIPQSGLNQYMILVARSAIGKEAMHSGISLIIKSVEPTCPMIQQFINFSDFASGPALLKACVANQSFVNVAGEFGRKLKRMSTDDGRDSPMMALRTVMTNLYQKSGPQSHVGGITYSSKDNNVDSVAGVSFSMIGETTPSTFYESLTTSMMEDGFLSRFIIIEYDGLRPPLNHSPNLVLPNALRDSISDFCNHSIEMMMRKDSTPCGRTEEAAEIMHNFELECDQEINGTDDESHRQMWNRASLKMMRLAALLAVADNHIMPIITLDHVMWSLMVIRSNIDMMTKHIESGDVGVTDFTREKKILQILAEYTADGGASERMRLSPNLSRDGIIPKRYIQQRLAGVSAFTNHRLGANNAIDITIKSLMDGGYIQDVDKKTLSDRYGFHGRCFRILNLPNFGQRVKTQ